MDSYIQGFILGAGAAVPIGAINILIMNYALKNYKSGVAIGFGAMNADITYLVLISLGSAVFLENVFISDILGLLGGGFLLYMAYLIFKGRKNKIDTKTQTVSIKNLFSLFIKGYILTLLNPYTVAFWLSIAGYTLNKDLNFSLTVAGMISAIILWITFMPYFVHISKHRISNKHSCYISVFSSIILAGFAFSLLSSLI
jgi:L-lysine exporter family protein LysE/ArgO